jgi:hypothetical protein
MIPMQEIARTHASRYQKKDTSCRMRLKRSVYTPSADLISKDTVGLHTLDLTLRLSKERQDIRSDKSLCNPGRLLWTGVS